MGQYWKYEKILSVLYKKSMEFREAFCDPVLVEFRDRHVLVCYMTTRVTTPWIFSGGRA